MSDDQFIYSKSGILPCADGSGFRVTITLEQKTEDAEATISLESIFQLPASEWPKVVDAMYRILRIIPPTKPSPSPGRGGAV